MLSKKTIVAGLVALSTVATAVPASAASLSVQWGHGPNQGYHEYRPDHRWGEQRRKHRLSTQEVRRILRREGFYNIKFLDRRGPVYQVRAINHRGKRVGITVSARSGAILNVYRI